MTIRIISLNVQNGGGKRARRISDWLATQTASVVVLPDWQNNTSGECIANELTDIGFQTLAAARRTPGNGLLLATIDLTKWWEVTPPSSVKDVPFVMIGDFNTGRNDLDIEGTGGHFYCVNLFEALTRSAGLIDLWRKGHGEKQEWSWRSSKKRNGFRIDHVFGNKAFIARFPDFRCAIDHAPPNSGLSDHSAVVLEVS